jgi:hypothetical protein
MRSFDDCTRNAFSPSFLQRLGERDEPDAAGEADVAGPWRVEKIPGPLFGLFREGESPALGCRPAAVFHRRWHALLAAAVYPGTGREALFRLAKEQTGEGFALSLGDGEPAGHLTLFDEALVAALHSGAALLRSPRALAYFLEAAGAVALERAGALLEERVP